MNLASPNSISSVEWMQSAIVVQRNQPLTWHRVKNLKKKKLYTNLAANKILASKYMKFICKMCRLISMHLKETNHWH